MDFLLHLVLIIMENVNNTSLELNDLVSNPRYDMSMEIIGAGILLHTPDLALVYANKALSITNLDIFLIIL